MAFNYLGDYKYESSGFIRNIIEHYGINGFVIAKSLIGLIILWIAYKLEFKYLLIGSTLAGIYVSISNFMIPITGHSLYLFGINSQIVSIGLIIIPCLIQIFTVKTFKDGLTQYEENIIDFNMIKYQEVMKELEK
jgi:hypothetical protein